MDGWMDSELALGEERGCGGFCSCPARLKDCPVLKKLGFWLCLYIIVDSSLFFFFLPPLKSPVLLIRREGKDGASSPSHRSYRYRPAPPAVD